jgi:hypothetical protein
MDSNYNVIKLTNGVTLVGNVLFAPEDILVHYPLEVYSKPVIDATGKIIGEQMVLRPYLIMTQDYEVIIDTYNVLCSSILDPRLHHSYEEMVSKVYSTNIRYNGGFYKEAEVQEEITKEQAEYMQEILDNMLGKDKIIH